METVLGFPISTWNMNLGKVLDEKNLKQALDESPEDSRLPYFANRTLGQGILEGSIADVALLIYYNDGLMDGYMSAYADLALRLALSIDIDWEQEELSAEMERLRDLAD